MYVKHKTTQIPVMGTCLQGEINATYAELCDLFGSPTVFHGSGCKSDAQWNIDFDGTVATIYNYKDGPNYCGVAGTPVTEIKRWHVGGHKAAAYDAVKIALDLHREQKDSPSGPGEELLQTLDDMLACVSAQRGEKFADAVFFAAHIQKSINVFNMLVKLRRTDDRTDKAAEVLANAFAEICATLLYTHCEALGVADTKEDAMEITRWADRLAETEHNGAMAILRGKGAS